MKPFKFKPTHTINSREPDNGRFVFAVGTEVMSIGGGSYVNKQGMTKFVPFEYLDDIVPVAKVPKVKKTLLYCWVTSGFCVLVPKQRGEGYVQVPYGHHHNAALSDIGVRVGCDVEGLDGCLYFECGGKVFHGVDAVRTAFAATVVPMLEKHYNMDSREIGPPEFWQKQPIK